MLSFNEWLGVISLIGSFVLGAIGWSLWGSWWLSKKFSEIKGLFFDRMERLETNILGKLEYHERHDDKRFADIRDDIWDIRVRNAAKDGMTPLIFRERDRDFAEGK